MAKTVFDSSERKRADRARELEAELAQIKSEAKSEKKPESVKNPAMKPLKEVSGKTEKVLEKKEKAHRSPREYSQVLREAKGEGGSFSAFVAEPKNLRFENQHEKEQVLLVLRQHPILNIQWIFISILMVFAPFLVFPILPFATVFPGIFGVFALLVWYMLIIAYAMESFLFWYFNIYIITDERIIDVDFYSMIYKEVSEAKIDKIEDVTATTAGFLGAFFNYGTIVVQTAAEKRQFEFAAVPYPARVTKFLNELMLEEEREKMEGRVM